MSKLADSYYFVMLKLLSSLAVVFSRCFGGISRTSWPGGVSCNEVVTTDWKKLGVVLSVSPLCMVMSPLSTIC